MAGMELDKLWIGLGINTDGLANGVKAAEGKLKSMGGFIRQHAEGFRTLGMAATAAGGTIAAVLYKSVDAYGEAQAATAKLEAAQKALAINGISLNIERIKALATEIQSYSGISDEETQVAGAMLGTFRLTQQQIEALLPRVANLSKMYGVDMQQAAIMLGKGMTVSTAGLRRYGIVIDKALDPTKDFAGYLRAIDENTGPAAKRIGETLPGQMDILKQTIGDLMEEIGAGLVPMLTSISQAVLPIVQSVAAWIKENPKLAATLATIAAATSAVMLAVGPLLVALPSLVSAFTILSGALPAVGAALAALTGPVGLVVAGVAALVAAFATDFGGIRTATVKVIGEVSDYLRKAWDGIAATARAWWPKIKDTILLVWQTIGPAVRAYLAALAGVIAGAWAAIKTAASVAWHGIAAVVSVAWQLVRTTVGQALDTILSLVRATMRLLQGDWRAAWDEIAGWARRSLDRLVGLVSGVANTLYQHGRAMVTALVRGIKDMALAPYNAVRDALAKLRKLLPSSDPEEGPLQHLTQLGRNIPLVLAAGMMQGIGAVRAAGEAIMGAARAALGGALSDLRAVEAGIADLAPGTPGAAGQAVSLPAVLTTADRLRSMVEDQQQAAATTAATMAVAEASLTAMGQGWLAFGLHVMDATGALAGGIASTGETVQREMSEWSRASQEVMDNIRRSFEDTLVGLVEGTRSFRDFWKDVWHQILQVAVHALVQLVTTGRNSLGSLGGILGGLFGGGGGGGASLGGVVADTASRSGIAGIAHSISGALGGGFWGGLGVGIAGLAAGSILGGVADFIGGLFGGGGLPKVPYQFINAEIPGDNTPSGPGSTLASTNWDFSSPVGGTAVVAGKTPIPKVAGDTYHITVMSHRFGPGDAELAARDLAEAISKEQSRRNRGFATAAAY